MNISYIKVYWVHDHTDEPSVFFYQEVGGRVRRVIELWDDGSLLWADDMSERGGAKFPDQLLSRDDWTNAPEFPNVAISAERFEVLWASAVERSN